MSSARRVQPPLAVSGVFGAGHNTSGRRGGIPFRHRNRPANTPGTMFGCRGGMLRLHIACHPAAPAEIMPFCETLDHPEFPVLPGEAIWTGRAFWVKGRGVKMDGNGFRYKVTDFSFFSEH